MSYLVDSENNTEKYLSFYKKNTLEYDIRIILGYTNIISSVETFKELI